MCVCVCVCVCICACVCVLFSRIVKSWIVFAIWGVLGFAMFTAARWISQWSNKVVFYFAAIIHCLSIFISTSCQAFSYQKINMGDYFSQRSWCMLCTQRQDRHWWVCMSADSKSLKNSPLPCHVQQSNTGHCLCSPVHWPNGLELPALTACQGHCNIRQLKLKSVIGRNLLSIHTQTLFDCYIHAECVADRCVCSQGT